MNSYLSDFTQPLKKCIYFCIKQCVKTYDLQVYCVKTRIRRQNKCLVCHHFLKPKNYLIQCEIIYLLKFLENVVLIESNKLDWPFTTFLRLPLYKYITFFCSYYVLFFLNSYSLWEAYDHNSHCNITPCYLIGKYSKQKNGRKSTSRDVKCFKQLWQK